MKEVLDFRENNKAATLARQVTLLMALLVVLAVAALGQDNRVCLYDQPNYGGQSICFNAGETAADFQRLQGGWNDRVASIRVFGNVQATIYEDVGFGGGSYVVTTDVPEVARLRANELRNWRSQISSIRVERSSAVPSRTDRQDRPERADRVCLYDQPNYAGQSACFNVGESSSDLQPTGWNDRAASIRIFGEAEATIYEHAGFGGSQAAVTSDVPNLSQVPLNASRGNFGQKVSAIRVERRGRGPNTTPGDLSRAVPEDASRLGRDDYAQGRPQNYRTHTGRYDRSNEREFERLYNDGYREARENRGGGGGVGRGGGGGVGGGGGFGGSRGPFRGLQGAYSGQGQLEIGNRTQQVTEVLVRLRPGGVAEFEVSGDMPRTMLSGNWRDSGRGQIDVTLNRGFGPGGVTGSGTLYLRNDELQRMELTGQTNRRNFSLVFREDDSRWGGGGESTAGRPNGTSIHHGGILNRRSGKALDVTEMSMAGGASIQQWDFARQPNQTWDVIDLGNGEVAIISDLSGMALTVQGGSMANGANIVQRPWRSNPFQRWRLEQVGGGFVRIINVGSGKTLDVRDQSRVNGANLQQWDYANQPNQHFRLTR